MKRQGTTFAIALLATSAAGLVTPGGTRAAPASTGAEPAEAIQEVVVTATRREERLQDVPLSVSALSGAELAAAGFQNVQDIQYQAAGVQFGQSPNDAGFRLRGVCTAGGFTSSSEQNVGTVVDGVVIPFGNPVASLGDVERVEVLKGPQGTQFGKNASSGVVSITTARPDTKGFSGSAFASFAQLQEHDLHGSVNVPLADRTAVSLYAFDRRHDGYIDNITLHRKWGGEHLYGARAKLLWQASDDFSLYLIADWSQQKQDGPGQLWTLRVLPSFANPLMAARFGPLLAAGIVPGNDNSTSAEDTATIIRQKNYGASLQLDWTLGGHTLTSLTAYRKFQRDPTTFGIDATNLPVFVATNDDASDFVSEELRLTSPAMARLKYVAGLYGSQLRTGYGTSNCAQLRPALPFDPVIINISAGCGTAATTSKSVAAFADGSLRLAEQWRLLGGVRLTRDQVDAESFSVIDPNYPPGPGPNGFVVPYATRPLATGATSKSDWSGRIGLEYRPATDVMLFGTIARGYLGPTVTYSMTTGTRTEVKPQTVRDVTIGAKTQWLERRLTLNADVFFDRYQDLQTSVFNGFEFLTENAGGFDANGFELDTSYRFSARFGVNGSYTYSRTRFTDYVTACPNDIVAQGVAAVAAQCNAPGSTPGTPLFQARGFPLTGAPKNSATLGADYRQPVGGSLLVDGAVNYYYRSGVYYDVANSLSYQSSYGIVGANVGLGAAGGAWRVAVFVRNALDKRFHAAVIGLPFADAGGEVNWNTRDGRRTVGVSVEARF
ncbi:MAG: TonB-dependent receptor [Gammaproteobacteria bacterium]|nr:TonB-dependent receptor [Gammaproteobacteria bacterium]